MSERHLWAAVAELAIADHAKLIDAARKGRRLISIENVSTVVGTVEHEIATARQYFESRDWREVCEHAGLNIGIERIMRTISKGATTHQVSRRVAGPRTGQTIHQGAA